jgi:hypothetical protein
MLSVYYSAVVFSCYLNLVHTVWLMVGHQQTVVGCHGDGGGGWVLVGGRFGSKRVRMPLGGWKLPFTKIVGIWGRKRERNAITFV